jgi:hypothetical protein
MMATAFSALIFLASANVVTPSWQPDYSKAYTKAVADHRPLAVFLGEGAKPDLNSAAAKKLNDSYVVVFVDTASTSGKKLAASFEMTHGLVISDATAGKQALRLNGSISESDLTIALDRFADPTAVVTTTATTAAPVVYTAPVIYAPQSPCASGRCPNAR